MVKLTKVNIAQVGCIQFKELENLVENASGLFNHLFEYDYVNLLSTKLPDIRRNLRIVPACVN